MFAELVVGLLDTALLDERIGELERGTGEPTASTAHCGQNGPLLINGAEGLDRVQVSRRARSAAACVNSCI